MPAEQRKFSAEAPKREFSIESKGQKFGFVEFSSQEPSQTLVIHFPGFGSNAEEYGEGMHDAMDRKYTTLALQRYGEEYSKDALLDALIQVIQLSGKDEIILHGTSFGAAVVYDLVSDPAHPEFLESNHVRGVILETPVLDKDHLRPAVRKIPEKFLLGGALLARNIRSARSLNPKRGLVEVSRSEATRMLKEVLRQKTVGRKIEVPIHVIFADKESLSDNEKTLETLRAQAERISSDTMKSANDTGHHLADDQYWPMWEKERQVIDRFTETMDTQPE